MVLPLIIGAAGAIGGALISSNASKSAANTQAKAAENASDASVEAARLQIEAAEKAQGQITANLNPYRTAGLDALAQQQNALSGGFQYQEAPGLSASLPTYQHSAPSIDEYKQSPGYQFQLEQGQRAIDGSAASRGNLFSGATLKATQEYGQGLAAQDYQNFLTDYRTQQANAQNDFRQQQANQVNDYRSQQSNYQNQLSNAVASGQNAAAQANNAATNTAQLSTNALAQSGQAQAQGYLQAGNAISAGQIGSANAINTGINNALGAYQYATNLGNYG